MGKGADMSWKDIQNEFDIMNRMSCRPLGCKKSPAIIFSMKTSL